jgi:predicted acetyltransferase
VGRVLLICDDGNSASATAIERSGGVLEEIRVVDDGTRVRRHWIA